MLTTERHRRAAIRPRSWLAALALAAWGPAATGNVAACLAACRHARHAAMAPMHHGAGASADPAPMRHAAPSIGTPGSCGLLFPTGLAFDRPARPVLAVRHAVAARPHREPAALPTVLRTPPEPPPPRA